MKNDEEKRKLENFLQAFGSFGLNPEDISLDILSQKIMQLVKIAIAKKFTKLKDLKQLKAKHSSNELLNPSSPLKDRL
jgi:hypothetical protein